jgi:surface antigen
VRRQAKSNAFEQGIAPRRALRAAACAILVLGPALGACSMSFPMNSMLPDDVTGSLAKLPFGALLDEEDRRREKAALATALDPQGDGSTVHWENPRSGRKGALTAVGHAYPQEAKVCRAFLGDLRDGAGAAQTLQGTACMVSGGEWEVRDAKPFKKA